MKYIDADKLKSEIEKRLKNIRDYMRGTGMRYKGPKYFKAQGKESAYDALLNILDSLQQEQMMKEAVDGTVHHYAAVHYVSVDEVQLTERLKQFQDGDKVKLLIN